MTDTRGAAGEGSLRDRLEAQGLTPSAWSNGPGYRYDAHRHDYDKALVVARGSVAFGLVDSGTVVDLLAGERLDLPAGTIHDAIVGPDGVTCLEAHLPSGTFASPLARGRDW